MGELLDPIRVNCDPGAKKSIIKHLNSHCDQKYKSTFGNKTSIVSSGRSKKFVKVGYHFIFYTKVHETRNPYT